MELERGGPRGGESHANGKQANGIEANLIHVDGIPAYAGPNGHGAGAPAEARNGSDIRVNGHSSNNGHRPANDQHSDVHRGGPEVDCAITLVIPTRNEAGVIPELMRRLAAARGTHRVLFVDDSDDGTPEVILHCAEDSPLSVEVLHREPGDRAGGLGGAVKAGMALVRTGWIVVMDADLQHPPELADRLVVVGRARDVDVVVASRYVGSGSADGLGGHGRQAASSLSTRVAHVVFPGRLGTCSDPMSGFFAVRRSAIDPDRLAPNGFKVLMELLVRIPGLRVAEVPFVMAPRHAGESKASVREGFRFGRRLLALRLGLLLGSARASVVSSPTGWLLRVFGFGLVGASGLVVNTAALWVLNSSLGVHYLGAAALATQVSTAYLFVLTDTVVFRKDRPGTRRSRALGFFALNNVVLLGRIPVLAALVGWWGVDVLVANLATLVLAFAVRFVVTDAAIYRRGDTDPAAPAGQPIRLVVDPGDPPAALPQGRGGAPRRYLPYRYAIPDVATLGSQIELPELAYFRAQWLDNEADIEIRVGPTGDHGPRRRVELQQCGVPPVVHYGEHLGRLGANFTVRFGERIEIVLSPALAHSPHVAYTNVLEALLRFAAAAKGVVLLHSACVELDGSAVLISARTDTGKTGTVLKLVREYGARFLSDDMTIVHPDGRVGCYPKPLTISSHTLAAAQSRELTAGEWRRLRWQGRLHSREGRQFALRLSRLNLPIMAINGLVQRVVPPPKYPVDQLLPCHVIRSSRIGALFLIERGPADTAPLPTDVALAELLANTEDAYQFPPYQQLAPSVVIDGMDHVVLRDRERTIVRNVLAGIPRTRLCSPDFGWAAEIARILALGHTDPEHMASTFPSTGA